MAALDLQPRATQADPRVWTLAQAVAASPLIVLAKVMDPPLAVTSVPVALGNALANPAHAYPRVQRRFGVELALRGALHGEVLVDAALWQRDLEAHRRRVLQHRELPVSVPRLAEGLLESPQPGEPVVLLLRKTAQRLEFVAHDAMLHMELLDVVRALLAR